MTEWLTHTEWTSFHFIYLLGGVCVCAQSCLTLCNCSPPGSSAHGIFQAEYWSTLPLPPPGDLPHLGVKPASLVPLHWQADSLLLRHMGSPDSHFIMLCQFLLYSEGNQLHVYIHPLFFGFPSHLSHHRSLSRVPCAIQQFWSILFAPVSPDYKSAWYLLSVQ